MGKPLPGLWLTLSFLILLRNKEQSFFNLIIDCVLMIRAQPAPPTPNSPPGPSAPSPSVQHLVYVPFPSGKLYICCMECMGIVQSAICVLYDIYGYWTIIRPLCCTFSSGMEWDTEFPEMTAFCMDCYAQAHVVVQQDFFSVQDFCSGAFSINFEHSAAFRVMVLTTFSVRSP